MWTICSPCSSTWPHWRPTVCRLNGSVFGGATDLALACDFRVGIDGMQLRMPAARLGLRYHPSGLRHYVSRLGLATAKRLFLLARAVPAAPSAGAGLPGPPGRRRPAGRRGGPDRRRAGVASLALRGMKASINEIARGEFHLDTLRERESLCAASADLQAGKASFADKRTRRFTGR